MHPPAEPSPFVLRFGHLLAPQSAVLDLACGAGRHARWFASSGHRVTAVDRDAEALAGLAGVAGVTVRQVDLETGPWSLQAERFDVVVVTNYLWRPRFEELLECVGLGGLLIYETFARGNERYGRPSRPEFLLERDELFTRLAPRGRVLVFEQGERRELDPGAADDAVIQRILWRRIP